ncbi:holin family protein [Neobittarella massiliensis]|nr:phage holin family protein [Neobittarella massiliensis]
MIEHVKSWKLAIAGLTAALSAIWGWFGWLVVLWVTAMTIDYLTGTAVAHRQKRWRSSLARDGIWHKLGSLVAVGAAVLLDILIGLVIAGIPAISLPFDYTVGLSPVVLVWYTLTELGSILENAGALGAPIPTFLKRGLAALEEATKCAGDPENAASTTPKRTSAGEDHEPD